jgi:signal transduction histidine kinase
MIEKLAATDSVRFTKTLDRLDDLFPKEAEINVYRIVQECVTNIIKHAAATEASVTVTRTDGGVTVTVRDNGKGFVPDGGRGFGLISIAERARLFGGEPQIHSAPGQGTTIQMTLEVDAVHGARDTDSARR